MTLTDFPACTLQLRANTRQWHATYEVDYWNVDQHRGTELPISAADRGEMHGT
jgi:hypothetical protein